jgi:radical SAM-linked protein
MDDVDSIVQLVNKVNDLGRRVGGGKRVTASVGAHVPKAFTPFQWEGFEPLESLEAKLAHLKRRLNNRFVRLKWHDLRPSFMESVFSLGDRRVGRALHAAWRRGARFDGWGERFDWNLWMAAFREVEIDPNFYARARSTEEILPWDLLDADITKKFLLRERRKAFEERLTNDCRWGDCHMCGIPGAPDDIRLSVDLKQAQGVEGRIGLDGNAIPKAGFARRIAITQAPAPVMEMIPGPAESESSIPIAHDPQPIEVRNVRIRYRTGQALRFLAHGDLMRAFHRAFRITGIPVVFSQGFTPRPRAAFGPPLPVGITGVREAMDLELSGPPPDDLVERLNAALPEGLEVLEVGTSPEGPALAAAVVAADYRVALPHGLDRAALAERVAVFDAADSIPVTKERHGRPDRTIDLKRAVLDVGLANGNASFRLAVNQADGHQANAELTLSGLFGLDRDQIAACAIERLALYDANGRI